MRARRAPHGDDETFLVTTRRQTAELPTEHTQLEKKDNRAAIELHSIHPLNTLLDEETNDKLIEIIQIIRYFRYHLKANCHQNPTTSLFLIHSERSLSHEKIYFK